MLPIGIYLSFAFDTSRFTGCAPTKVAIPGQYSASSRTWQCFAGDDITIDTAQLNIRIFSSVIFSSVKGCLTD
jgi:hypothetical protein